MVIKPIPKKLLPHTVTLIHSDGEDRWGKPLNPVETEIKHVRVVPSSQLNRNNYAETIEFNHLLIIDAFNSKGDKPFTLTEKDKIKWKTDQEVEITKVTPCYADKDTPHHWEVELT